MGHFFVFFRPLALIIGGKSVSQEIFAMPLYFLVEQTPTLSKIPPNPNPTPSLSLTLLHVLDFNVDIKTRDSRTGGSQCMRFLLAPGLSGLSISKDRLTRRKIDRFLLPH